MDLPSNIGPSPGPAGASPRGAGPDLTINSDLALPENRILNAWRDFFEAAQEVSARLEERLRQETGSDLGEFNLLMALAEAPDHTLTMSALAKRLVFSIPRLSYRVNTLSERGWVVKSACAEDKRASNVELTTDGIGRLQHVGAVHREHIREIFDANLTVAEMETLAELTARMRTP